MIEIFLFLFISIVLLLIAANLYTKSLINISQILHISPFVVGTIIVSISTTLPEITDVVLSNLIGVPEIGVGDIIGSCMTNIALILGITALISPIKLIREESRDSIVLGIISLLFLIFLLDGIISRIEGFSLFLIFLIYQYYLYKYRIVKETLELEYKPDKKELFFNFVVIPLSVFIIINASYIAIKSINLISIVYKISSAFLGMTLLAISTSLPELSISIISSLKRSEKLAMGDLFGANIVNIGLALSISSIIKPIVVNPSHFIMPIVYLVIFILIFERYVRNKKRIGRLEGISLILFYVGFLVVSNISTLARP